MTKTGHLEPPQRTICPGCRTWVPWYVNKKGKTVKGCQLGLIPEMRDGQWYCSARKGRRPKVKKEVQ